MEKVLMRFSTLIRSVQFSFVIALSGLIAAPACATVIFSASGISKKGVPVKFDAQLTIAGNVLTVQLTNDSPVDSLNPDDLIGSFYFDILDGSNNRPTLTYTSAVGDVYLADKDNLDSLQTANADLQAFVAGDDTWQFKTMDALQVPLLGFGIGTVGNSDATPNNFNGNIVGAIEYSIYRGEITTQNLDGKLLVKDTATFTFTGVSGFSESDIVDAYAFGLGTAPDSFLAPEPRSAILIGIGVLGIAASGWRRRKRLGRQVGRSETQRHLENRSR
jgi:hypothetical protein